MLGNAFRRWRGVRGARARDGQAGYSLLEILIVLAIIALIATLVGPRLFNQLDRSKMTAASAQIRSSRSGLDTLRLDIGRYPTEGEGLALLVSPPSDPGLQGRWFGPYMEGDVPLDPWGNPYRYTPPGTDDAGFVEQPYIYSYGADDAPGGTGVNGDIGNIPS